MIPVNQAILLMAEEKNILFYIHTRTNETYQLTMRDYLFIFFLWNDEDEEFHFKIQKRKHVFSSAETLKW